MFMIVIIPIATACTYMMIGKEKGKLFCQYLVDYTPEINSRESSHIRKAGFLLH